MGAHSPLSALTPKQLSEAEELLAGGRAQALRKARYFASVAYKVVPRVFDATPEMFTAGVTERGILLWSPHYLLGRLPDDWFKGGKAPAKLTLEQIGGLWIHEVLHLVNAHAKRRGARDTKLFNAAADLAINPSVREIGVGVCADWLWPKDFGFAENLTADEYYALLVQQQQQSQAKQGSSCSKKKKQKSDQSADGSSGDSGGDKPQPGKGWCGSCAGRAVPDEPGEGDAEGRSEADLERAVKDFAEAVKAAAQQGRGSVPAGILRLADDVLKPPKVPWRRKLGALTRRAVAWAAGSVDHRYDAPSRRQAGIGYGAGSPVLARLRAPIPRVTVAVDTSGSMGTEELSRAVSETVGVAKAVGAAVQLYSCDAEVHAAAPVRSLADVARNLKGGGGTLFQPVFDALERAKPRPDVVVFVTDGGCFDTPKQPRGIRVVWVLVGKHRCRPNGVDFGDFVEVDED